MNSETLLELFASAVQEHAHRIALVSGVRESSQRWTYAELFRAQNLDIILRTLFMAILVTLACAVIAFPIAYFAARYARGRWKALFYLGVMLPLWSSYLVKVYAWKLILAKEGIITWAATGIGAGSLLDGVLATPVIIVMNALPFTLIVGSITGTLTGLMLMKLK